MKLNLELIGELKNPYEGKDYNDVDNEWEYEDQLDQLRDRADFIVIHKDDGVLEFAATHNRNFGICGCCAQYTPHESYISKFQFFKILGFVD